MRKKNKKKRLKRRLDYLKVLKSYLETSPTKEYLTKEMESITGRLQLVNDMFEPNDKILRKENTKLLVAHNKTWNVKQLKDQLKTVKYLLS